MAVGLLQLLQGFLWLRYLWSWLKGSAENSLPKGSVGAWAIAVEHGKKVGSGGAAFIWHLETVVTAAGEGQLA